MENKPTLNVLCYSQYRFDEIMAEQKWYYNVPKDVCIISICSKNEEYEHWFKKDWHNYPNEYKRIFNLDIDDCGPFWFGSNENDCYDKALKVYIEGNIEESNSYFNHDYTSGPNKEYFESLHVLDYKEAFDLVCFINRNIERYKIKTIFIHCAVGASRSQGVVRYILDTYGNRFDIKTNPENPCIIPNAHLCMMLKRAYRCIFNEVDDSYMDTLLFDKKTFEEHTKDIKLNII